MVTILGYFWNFDDIASLEPNRKRQLKEGANTKTTTKKKPKK